MAWEFIWLPYFGVQKYPQNHEYSYSETWWSRQTETISTLSTICEAIPLICGFPSQRASDTGFEVFFDVSLSKRLNKQTSRRWFETPDCSLWR